MKQQGLSSAELEASQKIQTHFPRGLSAKVLGAVNSCSADVLTGAIERMLTGLANGAKTAVEKLLNYVTSIKVGDVSRFVAKDFFKEGKTVDGVKIAWLGDNFKKFFLPKVEENVTAAEIRVQKLAKPSKDLGIRAEIGEENEEAQLAHLWQCLKLQGEGGEGALLTNGWANIFYIRDHEGNLWAVNACWFGDGWRVHAVSVGNPDGWDAGRQVCSR